MGGRGGTFYKGAGGRCYLHDHLTEPQRLRHVTEQIRSITKNADCCHRDLFFLNFPGLGSIRMSTARVRTVDEAFVMRGRRSSLPQRDIISLVCFNASHFPLTSASLPRAEIARAGAKRQRDGPSDSPTRRLLNPFPIRPSVCRPSPCLL